MNEICIEKFPQKTDAEKYVHKTNKKITGFFVELVEFCKEKNIEVSCKVNNMLYSIDELNQLRLIPFVKFEEEIKYKGSSGVLISLFLPKQWLYTYKIIYFAEPKYEFLFYDRTHQLAQGWSILDYEILFNQDRNLIDSLNNLEIFKEKVFKDKEPEFKLSLPEARFYEEDEVI